MSNEFDNRRSFRITETVYLKALPLSEDEYARGLEHHKMKLGLNDGVHARLLELDARLHEALLHLGNEGDHVGRCLTMLNEKLNLVISELPSVRKRRTQLAQQAPQRCEISADGLVFTSEHSFEKGDKLHIQMLLSDDGSFVESFAEVIRLTEPPVGDEAAAEHYGICVEFRGMRPEQRETLFQHMFMHETQALRLRRLQEDQDN